MDISSSSPSAKVASPMLQDFVPNFPEEEAKLDALAPGGWIMGFNISYKGAEVLINRYPPGWQVEYEENNYFFGDPILVWTMTKTGAIRWSKVGFPDLRGIMEGAARHGLRYGATVTKKYDRKRCFLSMARPDREFTDAEIEIVEAKFTMWCELLLNKARLTEGELDVLRSFRNGHGQRECAAELGISEATVKQRLSKACSKLGATSRTQAVAMAGRPGGDDVAPDAVLGQLQTQGLGEQRGGGLGRRVGGHAVPG